MIGRTGLEVALSAEQHADEVLVLELIQSCRLSNRQRRRARARNRTRVLLVQLRPVDVGCEGQVLDRGPDDVGTDDSQVEVRVAGADEAKQRHRVGTDRRLASTTVMSLGIRTINVGGPVRGPVVGETTAEAPSLDRLKPGGCRAQQRTIGIHPRLGQGGTNR